MDIGKHKSFIYVCMHAYIHICVLFFVVFKNNPFYEALIEKIILSILLQALPYITFFLKHKFWSQKKKRERDFNSFDCE